MSLVKKFVKSYYQLIFDLINFNNSLFISPSKILNLNRQLVKKFVMLLIIYFYFTTFLWTFLNFQILFTIIFDISIKGHLILILKTQYPTNYFYYYFLIFIHNLAQGLEFFLNHLLILISRIFLLIIYHYIFEVLVTETPRLIKRLSLA